MLGRFSRTTQLLSATLAVMSLAVTAAVAQPLKILPERVRASFPQFDLGTRQLSGQAAVSRLGARLPEIAAWYGKSPEALRELLLSDKDLRVDAKGRLFVVDELPAPLAADTATAEQQMINGQLLPLDQTFLLHSRPGANRTIYLDFTGETLTGTAWNSGGNTITAKPFDIDGNPASFSVAELQRIQFIWQRVAEDYAPFDVNITTEPPPADRLARTDANDLVFGTTVLVTDNTGVYSCNCGGVAYVGIFNLTSSYYKPALVFYNKLGNGDEKSVAEAISHEAGHNIGLNHDGTASAGYYTGQGSDAVTGWAPIMGVGYFKPLVQFSKGEYSSANNREDDFAVAQSFGLPLRADDFGSTTATAAALPAGGTVDGVIEAAGDADIFSFTSLAGAFSASLQPASRSPNADLVLTLLDGNGQVLASSNPLNALNASLSYQLPAAGTYFIRVSATGQGNAATTGYSAYGSVGNYRLATSFTIGGAAPNAVLTASATSAQAPAAITLDASQSSDSDGTVRFYYWDFGDGTGDTSGSLRTTTKTYAAAGTYVVRLTVVDNTGLSASASQTISVAAAAPTKSVSVQSLNVTLSASRNGSARARGTIVVVNQLGQVMRGATVSAVWSGVVNKAVKARSGRTGKVTLTSPPSKATGCFTLTVTSISLAGYSVDTSALPARQACR